MDTYSGLWLPGETGRAVITDATLIVKAERAETQRAVEGPIHAATDDTSEGSATSETGGTNAPAATAPAPVIPSRPVARRFVGSAPISTDRYTGDFAKIASEVLANLADVPGVKLTLNFSVDAVAPDGFTEQQVRTIRENASTLKFTTKEFESD